LPPLDYTYLFSYNRAMKTYAVQMMARRTMALAATIAMLSVMAYADPGKKKDKHKGGGDDDVPAAPEPAVLAMVAGGVLLAGGYLTLRLRRLQGAKGSSRA
jgi:hypothetical protein